MLCSLHAKSLNDDSSSFLLACSWVAPVLGISETVSRSLRTAVVYSRDRYVLFSRLPLRPNSAAHLLLAETCESEQGCRRQQHWNGTCVRRLFRTSCCSCAGPVRLLYADHDALQQSQNTVCGVTTMLLLKVSLSIRASILAYELTLPRYSWRLVYATDTGVQLLSE